MSSQIKRSFNIISHPKYLKIPYSCILLNGPKNTAKLSPSQFQFWQQATSRVTVDGGYNVWKNTCHTNFLNLKKPEFIYLGDSDSVESAPKKLLADKGNSCSNFSGPLDPGKVRKFDACSSQVITHHDQNFTDFDKCLLDLGQNLESKILVLSWGTMTRLDHIFSFPYVLNKHQNLDVEMLFHNNYDGVTSFLFCLPKNGRYLISYPENLDSSGKSPPCGIFPLYSENYLDNLKLENQKGPKISTSGLRWNVENFQQLPSSSNRVEGSEVVVETSSDLFYTTQIEDSWVLIFSANFAPLTKIFIRVFVLCLRSSAASSLDPLP